MIHPLLTIFYDNMRHDYSITNKHTSSYFGGPLEQGIYSPNHEFHHLHQIAYICPNDLPKDLKNKHRGLPLVFGLQHDACELKYLFDVALTILELDPPSPDLDWPYEHFPRLLPYWPLQSQEPTPMQPEDYHDFLIENPPDSRFLIAALKPPTNIGISLWGPDGDAESVTIIWRVDFNEKIIETFTRCT